MKLNKGTILKASVDYIKHLQRDQVRLRQMQDQNFGLEKERQRMFQRIQVRGGWIGGKGVRGWMGEGGAGVGVDKTGRMPSSRQNNEKIYAGTIWQRARVLSKGEETCIGCPIGFCSDS